MKQSSIIILLTVLMSMVCIKASAHDIAVQNADGVTIYYLWNNNKTELSVSFKGAVYKDCDYSGSVVIPKSVEYNGISYSVTSIGEYAFYNCSGLISVTIPQSITSIKHHAFYACSSLTSMIIPSSVTSISNNLFDGCSSLSSVTIPNSIKSIEMSAFNGCSSLTSITIPNSVTSIGRSAFAGCRALISVKIPNKVSSIGDYAFHACSSLTSIISEINRLFKIDDHVFYSVPTNACLIVPKGEKTSYQSMSGWKKIKYIVELGEGGEIGQEFESNGLLFTISENKTDCVISGAKNVSGELVLPYQTTFNGVTYNVTSIGKNAFKDCCKITSVTIPNSVTSIDDYAFAGCI